jgi:hypothetical protein
MQAKVANFGDVPEIPATAAPQKIRPVKSGTSRFPGAEPPFEELGS